MDRSLRRTYGGIFGTSVLPEMPQTILDELNELDDADDSDFLEFEDQSTEAENTVYQEVQTKVFDLKGHECWKTELINYKKYTDE